MLPVFLVFLAGCACNGKDKDAGTSGTSDTNDTNDPSERCGYYGDIKVTAASIRLESADCGSIVLEDFSLVGDGDLEWAMFSSGDQVLLEIKGGAAGGTFRALHLSGTWSTAGAGDPVLWRQGYQSWSASGVFELDQTPLTFDGDGVPIAGGDDGVFQVVEETPGTSWWVGLAGRADGVSVAAGAVTSMLTRFYVAFEGDEIHVVWGGRGEEIELGAGESVFLDPLWLGLGGDPVEVLDVYAAQVENTLQPPALKPAISGWGSWNQYYEDVTEADISANIAAASALSGSGGNGDIEVIQIDDGWSNSWGDWTANEKFPSGMGALAAEISAAGFVPGVWMAPFHVDRNTQVYADNPGWFLKVDGVEVEYMDRAIIDASHAGARSWMAQQVGDRVAEGFGYVKLDFLFAGAMEGERFQSMTGIEAYHLAMTDIRSAVGDDTWILACGAPMLPSVGHADSWRSGPDIAFSVAPDPDLAFLRNQVRSTAARGFANGVWWFNDADVLLVRDPTTADGVSGAVVANAISGGVWLLGDDLGALPADRASVALNGAAMATSGASVAPQDPLAFVSGFDTSPVIELGQGDDEVPTTWVLSSGQTALLNMSDQAIEVDGPGGTELLSGSTAGAGPRTLAPGAGELWE